AAGDFAHAFEGIPPVGESDRLVVFLRRPGALPEWTPRPDLPVASSGWESASYMDADLRISAVWIQDGVTYAFQQTMNPGPTQLTRLPMSEAELRKSIQLVLKLRDDMDRAVANPDPVERGQQLAALVCSENGIARMSALEKLERGGASETNVLFDLLSDRGLLGVHQEFIGVLVRKRAADPRFAELLREETSYWLQECPALKPGWWFTAPASGSGANLRAAQCDSRVETAGHHAGGAGFRGGVAHLSAYREIGEDRPDDRAVETAYAKLITLS
ncbi:MAG TPA: hypothetical protein VG897_18145, partial [Terriglobales bacterium]|nr:hypothetical protein [Terriglobales bacterium]